MRILFLTTLLLATRLGGQTLGGVPITPPGTTNLAQDIVFGAVEYTDIPGAKVFVKLGWAKLLSKSAGVYSDTELTIGAIPAKWQFSSGGEILIRQFVISNQEITILARVNGSISATATATLGGLVMGGVVDVHEKGKRWGEFVAYEDSTSLGKRWYGGMEWRIK